MELTQVNISEGNSIILEQVRRLYEASFPADERRRWSDIAEKLNDKASGYSLKVITVDEFFAGFITQWMLPECVFVEHFAIAGECRGCGIGGKVIDRVIADAGVPVVLEAEMPEKGEMARRRIGFYRRHGFVACEGFDYIQPSYDTGQPLLLLMLMITDTSMDISAVARKIHRVAYNVDW